jgi:YfiR/HmsC-like
MIGFITISADDDVARLSRTRRPAELQGTRRELFLPIIPGRLARALAMILCLFFCGAEAQVQHADEDRVKAAYLYNFAKFVEWPTASFAGPDDPTIICSVGDDRLADILQQTVSGKQTKGRPVAARQVSSQEQFKSCHILLITFQDKERISQILRWVQSSTVLTVGQSSEFTHLGGMINLVRNDSTLELEINPRAAEAAGLKISSRLLAVSRVVALPRGGGNS